MSEINLEVIDRTEEWEHVRVIKKFMEDWVSLIYDSSVHTNPVEFNIDYSDSSQLTLTFNCNFFENE